MVTHQYSSAYAMDFLNAVSGASASETRVDKFFNVGRYLKI